MLAACQGRPPPPPPPPPAAATVDGQPILVAEVQRELDRLRRGEGEATAVLAPGATPAEAGRAILDKLIERRLLLARAGRDKLQVSDAEVERATDALADAARRAGQSFRRRLDEDGQTAERLAAETRETLLARRVVASLAQGEPATDDELRAFFEAHRTDYQAGEQVHALHLVVATAAQAKSLLDQARKGAPFDQLARAHSTSPDGRRGGDLGWFSRGTMPKAFDDACFALKPGELSGVVASPYGFHVFKLLGRQAARRRGFDEVKAEVSRRVAAERRAQAEAGLVASLREKAVIQLDEKALALLQ